MCYYTETHSTLHFPHVCNICAGDHRAFNCTQRGSEKPNITSLGSVAKGNWKIPAGGQLGVREVTINMVEFVEERNYPALGGAAREIAIIKVGEATRDISDELQVALSKMGLNLLTTKEVENYGDSPIEFTEHT